MGLKFKCVRFPRSVTDKTILDGLGYKSFGVYSLPNFQMLRTFLEDGSLAPNDLLEFGRSVLDVSADLLSSFPHVTRGHSYLMINSIQSDQLATFAVIMT